MRLLFNATNLRSEGGVVLLKHLLSGFLAHELQLEMVLYLNPELLSRLPEDLRQEARLEVVPFRPQGALGRFFWEQRTLPGLIRKRRIDVLFSFGNTGPRFAGCRQILYVQQSIPYTRYRPKCRRLKWEIFRALYGFLIGLAQCGAARIVVPTSWLVAPMRQSVGNRVPVERYVVTLPGVPDLPALPENALLAASEIQLLESLEQWRASDERIVLYPCYLAPYKNIPYLLDSIRTLMQTKDLPTFRLLLTFDAYSREYFPCRGEILAALQALEPDWAERVILTGSLGRFAMAEVYRRTDILAFPSLVETLGLPLLEAMSHGIPVVACQSPQSHDTQAAFAKEICGDAALYADPARPADFAAQLEKLLRDPVLAFETGQKGLTRSQALSWEAHLQAILG